MMFASTKQPKERKAAMEKKREPVQIVTRVCRRGKLGTSVGNNEKYR